MRLKPIKTWSLINLLALKIRCGAENHEGQGQGQAKVKFMDSSMVKESTKSLKTYVVEETSQEEPCYIMSEKNTENKDKERVEEKERLVERSFTIDSISIISKENEHFGSSKEKESEFEKSEKNFEDASKDQGRKLAYKVSEFAFHFTNGASCVLGVEDKGRRMEKTFGTILEDISISFSLNPSLMWHEVQGLLSMVGPVFSTSSTFASPTCSIGYFLLKVWIISNLEGATSGIRELMKSWFKTSMRNFSYGCLRMELIKSFLEAKKITT
ncbi:hypothetical protein M9H77_23448 [Catharanthus roseus]|uniref:Uncharacterized protein n=1 Tax=Catharanthus roseus TaxID=4058 RepID=A0ACC0AUV2_CATRO|nr:hypothetical protein M9H77_23448 [Catharanthus roseus]